MDKQIQSTIEKYIEKYGMDCNLLVLVEELAELQKAILKHLRITQNTNAVVRIDKEKSVADIKDELADVDYCLRYLELFLNISTEERLENEIKKASRNSERFDNIN
ncbi:MAG: hypothetical protein LBM93_08550 [Oscillospiraceae bacterium]|jgi:NTP pyrophosphatase (non-canonical NTP hydrolase)|nr:hypothetical protein [Oscillospiraceae bacterium]